MFYIESITILSDLIYGEQKEESIKHARRKLQWWMMQIWKERWKILLIFSGIYSTYYRNP